MQTKKIIVAARAGKPEKVTANLVICEHCFGEVFNVFFIGEHCHMQCFSCGISFCDGTCEEGTNIAK